MAGSERKRELRRRRNRKKKLTALKAKAMKAKPSDKELIAAKLRKITPGAEQLILDWQLKA